MSAPRRDDLVHDMVDISQEIAGYVASWDQASFLADRIKQRVLERTLEILGEAANQLGDERPDIAVDWRALLALRIVLAHRYGRIEPIKLWRHATVDVPQLQQALREWMDDGGMDKSRS